jgi:tetratricopeptide (TPR) repeat protein
MAQNALNQGFAMEAKTVLDQGVSNKVLSQSNDSLIYLQLRSEIKRKLEDEKRAIAKYEAETPSPVNAFVLMNIGLSLIHASDFDKGLSMMEKAVSLVPYSDRPQDARMHLAIAYLKAGKKTKALETFNLVGGVHGAADLSRLWAIFVKGDSF